MPTALIDLDKLAPVDKPVQLGGKRYCVPGDPPSAWYLRLTQLASADAGAEDDATQLGMLQDAIVDLLAIRQPDVAKPNTNAAKALRQALDEMGLLTTLKVIGAIYADLPDDTDDTGGAEGNGAAGTRSSSRRKTTKSRSTS